MANFLESLIFASERAANVARACNSSSNESSLLVAEKSDGEANKRFDKDFKTIADVLAQESARAEIGFVFPELIQHVRGEECAEINGVHITLRKNIDETAKLLSTLIPPVTAIEMAKAAHTKPELVLDNIPQDLLIDTEDLGVWIDPIDATSEFIAGVLGNTEPDRGLVCVTVLIGAYRRSTGEPVMGVINQPFYDNGKGRIIWGVSYNSIKHFGGINLNKVEEAEVVLMSSAEDEDLRKKLTNEGCQIKSLPGAGHKLMKVALGEASLYILSKDTTFRWDTCGPHAILKSRGGDILHYKTMNPLTYNNPCDLDTQLYCNDGGIIAYNNENMLQWFRDLVKRGSK